MHALEALKEFMIIPMTLRHQMQSWALGQTIQEMCNGGLHEDGIAWQCNGLVSRKTEQIFRDSEELLEDIAAEVR